jgi:hypothetical protein
LPYHQGHDIAVNHVLAELQHRRAQFVWVFSLMVSKRTSDLLFPGDTD